MILFHFPQARNSLALCGVRSSGVVVERGLSRVDVGGEEGVEEIEWGLVLAASGAEKAGEDGEGVSAGLGA